MKSKIVLQISDGYEDWVHYSAIKTTDTKGRSFFALSFEPNEDCYEGEQFEFRFAVAKSGSFKAFKSGIFLMAFVSDEDSPSCTLGEDDYGDN
jgi:hypothetical protein